MIDRKWTLYVIHHSHTDIGYTDLQEKIIFNHVDYIKNAIKIIKEGIKENSLNKNFKWNCETYFCVEKFLEEANEEEKNDFFEMVKSKNIGISATYLNFNDLVDTKILNKRTKEMVKLCNSKGIEVKSALNADVNGVSLGTLDVLLDNGIKYFFTNIHTHHGMYPLYQNQKAYYWENKNGKKIFVYSGEHYHLGNVLGLANSDIQKIKSNLDNYLNECVKYGYDYDFIPVGVSGVFSDNGPPNPDILKNIENFNKIFSDEIKIEMVTVDEFFEKTESKFKDVPVVNGDLNDWWSNGVGSTPYAVKHYKEAQRLYHLCEEIDINSVAKEKYKREAEDNFLLFAEHTWGHSATISNPFDTMVQNLDIRNISYASKAYEACAKNLYLILHDRGDKLRYYDRNGKLKVINPTNISGEKQIEFYIEAYGYNNIKIICQSTGEEIAAQLSPHPRGVLVSFVDYLKEKEEKIYIYEELPYEKEDICSRIAYMGAENVKDIVNDFDKISYKLPYQIENDFFKISYEIGKGVTSFYNKIDNIEMLKNNEAKFFTPIYEKTKVRNDNYYNERRLLGRNIRGFHAEKYIGVLKDVSIINVGETFTTIELKFDLEGTYYSSVEIKMYHKLPKIDFKYKVAKSLSLDIESLFLPLTLDNIEADLYVDKGNAYFKPGINQIPGTCMEYYLIDNGLIYKTKNNSIFIETKDAPLIYMGELKHHEIVLCNNEISNNKRDVYSWIMNNTWETNFKGDLSGISEFCYSLEIFDDIDIEKCFNKLKSNGLGIPAFII
jgi:hypothetical protein